jgi:hypothetical protein
LCIDRAGRRIEDLSKRAEDLGHVCISLAGQTDLTHQVEGALMSPENSQREKEEATMPDEQRVANNSQTYVADADTFQFETIEQKNGQATVIRFRLEDPRYHAGDVLVVLSGSEIHFHGMIGQLADGWAIASDHRGSLLAATVQ